MHIDLHYGDFARTPLTRSLSRHTFLARARDGFPSYAPSSRMVPSQGFVTIIGLEHQTTNKSSTSNISSSYPSSSSPLPSLATASSVDGSSPLTWRLVGTRSWSSFHHTAPLDRTAAQQWIGVELGNMHAAIKRRTQWQTQNYLVKSGPYEQAFDHSTFVRYLWKSADDSTSSADLSSPPSSTSLTFQSSLIANLSPGPPLAASPDLFGPKSNLLIGGIEVGIDRRDDTSESRLKLFVDSDGGLVGGSVWKEWKRKEIPSTLLSSSPSSSSLLSRFRRVTSHLPFRLDLGSRRGGLEFAWVNELRDYSAIFGMAQQFRFIDRQQSATTNSLFNIPYATFSGTMQFYGHITGGLHIPLTPRLTVASTFHAQLTNDESALITSCEYRLNSAQRVAFACDTFGGLKVSGETRLSSSPSSPFQSFLSRMKIGFHCQAFPILPALVPSWNIRTTSLTGNSYSPTFAESMRTSKFTFGLALQYHDPNE